MNVWRVIPGLYVSGALTPSRSYLPEGITAIVDLEKKSGFDEYVQPGTLYLHWGISDGPAPETMTARLVALFVQLLAANGHRVLVHCGAGINRSNLIIARALMGWGLGADEAIAWVRRTRGTEALSNPHFGEHI